MLFGWIPRWMVLELIQRYESKEIYFIQNEYYEESKNNLLKKRIIWLKEFQEFIETTKSDKHTKFKILPYKFILPIKREAKSIFHYDIKFSKYLYIQFSTFNKDVAMLVKQTIQKEKNYKYLILDLRDNGGGNLESCIMIAKELLNKCEILQLNYKDKITVFLSDCNYMKFERIFIMLNGSSASCSEILSLILKKHLDNVVLIGNYTYGKETVQHTITNYKYKFCFSISEAKWYVEGKTVKDLHKYMKEDNISNKKFYNTDTFIQFILDFQQQELINK
ncbi:S41 family peptidase [Clostridium estertheticum]|uniref:S41 family peptidase n=1 Tax=Clostridium estertheticum TaxID=238834 RepID=UPI001CF3350B|nr:S41 family peptidase [Clostridium estertheticum]MCB2362194.1 S41 family peptidase [Clostridium estertheticum]